MDHYSGDRLARLRTMEEKHFWYVGRRRLIARAIRRFIPTGGTVADIGCGAGGMSRWLNAHGFHPIALDGRDEGIAALAREGITALRADIESLPLEAASVDGALCLDVLEHVDDVAAIREIARILRPGASAIIAVPAGQWLWGVRDTDAGHLRRYSTKQLRQLLAHAGLEVAYLQRYQFFLFPLVVASRLLGRRSQKARDREDLPGPFANALLGCINRAEVGIGALMRWPLGSSIIVACRKPRT